MSNEIRRISVFTGHRDVLFGHDALIYSAVQDTAATADEFVFGGAAGGDTIALKAVCDLADAGKPFPRMHIIVAAKVFSQPTEARLMIGRAILLGATLEEMGLSYNGDSLKKRNRQMIDRITDPTSGNVLAYWRGIQRSGTFSAMTYARHRGIEVREIAL